MKVLLKQSINKIKPHLIIVIIFVFFTLLFTYPAVNHLDEKLIGDGGDNYQYIGFQNIVRKNIDSFIFPFGWTNEWKYPSGFEFSLGTDSIIFFIVGIIYDLFIRNYIIVFNLSVLTILTLNGCLSYLYFYKISNSKLLGLTGSVLYGYSFYVLARLGGHVNLILTSVVPFIVFSIITLKDKEGNLMSFFVLTVATILAFFSNLQYFLIIVAFLMASYLLGSVYYTAVLVEFLKLLIRRKKYILFFLFLMFGSFYVFNSGWLDVIKNGNIPYVNSGTMTFYSPQVYDFLQINEYQSLLIKPDILISETPKDIEKALYFGFMEIILFILFFINKKISFKFKLVVFFVFTIFVIFSLGCNQTNIDYCIYGEIYKYFPFFAVYEPGRYYLITYFILSTAIVILLKNTNVKIRTTLCLFVLTFLIIERLPKSPYLSDTLSDLPHLSVVRNLESKAVMTLPIYDLWAFANSKTRNNLLSIYYDKPMVDGYIHWPAETKEANKFQSNLNYFKCSLDIDSFSREQVVEVYTKLKSQNVNIIVLDKNDDYEGYPYFCSEANRNFKKFISTLGNIVTLEHSDNKYDVYYLN